MSESADDEILRKDLKEFEVLQFRSGDGFIYEIYFSSEQEAAQAVRDFWNTRNTEIGTKRGLESGMLNPTKHQITSGDRTHPFKLTQSDQQRHPGKLFKVQFNGNDNALSDKGVTALRQLGFIE